MLIFQKAKIQKYPKADSFTAIAQDRKRATCAQGEVIMDQHITW